MKHIFLLNFPVALLLLAISNGQQRPGFRPPPGGGPGDREHTANVAEPLDLVVADCDPPGDSEVSVTDSENGRRIVSNGLPDHKVGRFPNRDNPNAITEQDFDILIPRNPEPAAQITYLHGDPIAGGQLPGPGGLRVFGVTFDGVLMEPGTAESWKAQRRWNYEALGGAVPLGLDTNYAHVQPDGHYHYHGLPIDLMKRLGYVSGNHSPMIGWAADGFPMYAMYGFSDANDSTSEVVEQTTSWQLKKGRRPSGHDSPGGLYDGTFVQDYEFIEGSGELDECNGRFCITPEYPEGTYAYFLTREWPVIPRAFRGTPSIIGDGGGQGMIGFGGMPPGSRQPPRGGRPPGR